MWCFGGTWQLQNGFRLDDKTQHGLVCENQLNGYFSIAMILEVSD
jgi:hypothetical protein